MFQPSDPTGWTSQPSCNLFGPNNFSLNMRRKRAILRLPTSESGICAPPNLRLESNDLLLAVIVPIPGAMANSEPQTGQFMLSGAAGSGPPRSVSSWPELDGNPCGQAYLRVVPSMDLLSRCCSQMSPITNIERAQGGGSSRRQGQGRGNLHMQAEKRAPGMGLAIL